MGNNLAELSSATDCVSVDRHIGHILRRTFQRANANLAKHLQPFGLSNVRFIVLARLNEHGSLPQNRLGRLAAMEPANIHEVVRSMRDQGLLKTCRDPSDNRRMLVSLTPAGAELFDQVTGPAEQSNEKNLSSLKEEERRTLFELLDRVGRAD